MHDSFDAWLAGFIDGEGSIVTTKTRQYQFIYVVIYQHKRSRHVLEEIQQVYGGSISPSLNRNESGKWVPRNVLRLDIRSQTQVISLLESCMPHMRIKGTKAKKAIQNIRHWLKDGRKKRRWTKAEEAFMRQNYGKIPTKEISEKLNRSLQAVYSHVRYISIPN